MKKKYTFTFFLLCGVALLAWGFTALLLKSSLKQDDGKITVVTSFYPVYIAALNITGDSSGIVLENLSEPQTGCLHDFQLTPEDMKLLSKADLFLVNGGGIESFLSDVAEQYPELSIVNTTRDCDLLEDNAHAWMSIAQYRRQVAVIEEAVCQADPANAAVYKANASAYDDRLAELCDEQKKIRQKAAGAKVVSFHQAYAYLAEDYGLDIVYTMDLDEERQVSAGEVADVTAEIRDNQVQAVLAEELYGSGMGDTVKKETGVTVCYLDTLVRGDYDPDSYINGMKQNMELLDKIFVE